MDRAGICIERILKHEGGFVNHPRDPGGATNKGITIATFRAYINPRGNVEALRAMTTEQAVKIYRGEYWNKVRADDLPIGVDYAVADFAVNSGPRRAAIYLQEILDVAPDGKIGPITIAAANQWPARKLINAICDKRLSFLQRLSTWDTFGNGWSRRVREVRSHALEDADLAPVKAPDIPKPMRVQRTFWAVLVDWLAKLFSKGA